MVFQYPANFVRIDISPKEVRQSVRPSGAISLYTLVRFYQFSKVKDYSDDVSILVS